MTRFSAEVEDVLRIAGWSPGRNVDTAGWITYFEEAGIRAHEPAIGFLREFGGLGIQIGGSGITRAKEPFEFNPSLCEGEEDRFIESSGCIDRELFPVGELDRGRFFLGIDENSEIYVVETWVASFGTMPVAMENLVRGVRAADVARHAARAVTPRTST